MFIQNKRGILVFYARLNSSRKGIWGCTCNMFMDSTCLKQCMGTLKTRRCSDVTCVILPTDTRKDWMNTNVWSMREHLNNIFNAMNVLPSLNRRRVWLRTKGLNTQRISFNSLAQTVVRSLIKRTIWKGIRKYTSKMEDILFEINDPSTLFLFLLFGFGIFLLLLLSWRGGPVTKLSPSFESSLAGRLS